MPTAEGRAALKAEGKFSFGQAEFEMSLVICVEVPSRQLGI